MIRDVSPLEIRLRIAPYLTKQEAYDKSIAVLEKALHFRPVKKGQRKPQTQKEESPFKAYTQLQEQALQSLDSRLYNIFAAISKTWLRVGRLSKAEDDLPFKLDGRVYINPKTGKALTRKEWQKITRGLDKVLNWAFSDANEILAKRAIGLGKILASMATEEAVDASYDQVDPLVDWKDPYLENALAFAEQNAGIYITDLKSSARKKIQATIVDAVRNKQGTRELESRLFDQFSDTNRDWRRVAETEMQHSFQNGYMLTELEQSKREGREHTFVQGLSGPNACNFCRTQIDGKVFVLLDGPPPDGGDQVEVDGETYTAIWPGKSNVGRSRADWWVAFPAHPHCQCAQNKYDPQFAKYHDRLAARMKARMK